MLTVANSVIRKPKILDHRTQIHIIPPQNCQPKDVVGFIYHGGRMLNHQCCVGGILVYDALGGKSTISSDIDISMGSILFETEEGIR